MLPCVANYTIRNRSTVGGHVALADGLSEVNLLLHAAQAVIVTSEREITMELLQPAHRVAALHANELITAVIIPREMLRSAYGFCEFTLRPSGGRAIVAAVIRCDAGEPVRAVVAGITATPIVLQAHHIRDPRPSFEHARAHAEDIDPVARWPRTYRLQLGLEALERAHVTLSGGTEQ
jgi:CO/xanthine dehydrogenase FAD-binding subunit